MATHRLLLLKSSNKFYILHSALMDFGFSLLSLPLSLSLWTTDLLEVLSLLFIVFYLFIYLIL